MPGPHTVRTAKYMGFKKMGLCPPHHKVLLAEAAVTFPRFPIPRVLRTRALSQLPGLPCWGMLRMAWAR